MKFFSNFFKATVEGPSLIKRVSIMIREEQVKITQAEKTIKEHQLQAELSKAAIAVLEDNLRKLGGCTIIESEMSMAYPPIEGK